MEELGRSLGLAIGWMVDAIIDWHVWKKVRINAVEAAHVVTVLAGKRASLVMRVDAARGAVVVLGYLGVELVELQRLGTLENANSAEWYRGDDSALAPADRAVTASRVDDAVWKVKFKHDGATVT